MSESTHPFRLVCPEPGCGYGYGVVMHDLQHGMRLCSGSVESPHFPRIMVLETPARPRPVASPQPVAGPEPVISEAAIIGRLGAPRGKRGAPAPSIERSPRRISPPKPR